MWHTENEAMHHNHHIESSHLESLVYHIGSTQDLGDTFGGCRIYPEDILCGGTQYPRILCTKNRGCQISYDTGFSDPWGH